jgi:hypothetical protein
MTWLPTTTRRRLQLPITPQSPLLHARIVSPAALVGAILRHAHGAYTAYDLDLIIARYCHASQTAGLDPLLVVAQLCHETAYLSSWWSQRPRRNPAGLGVNGQPGQGLSFATWELAVSAHLGRLLAYALPQEIGSATQQALIAASLALRPLPARFRGVAPRLAGLAGTWATDAGYAARISAVANALELE